MRPSRGASERRRDSADRRQRPGPAQRRAGRRLRASSTAIPSRSAGRGSFPACRGLMHRDRRHREGPAHGQHFVRRAEPSSDDESARRQGCSRREVHSEAEGRDRAGARAPRGRRLGLDVRRDVPSRARDTRARAREPHPHPLLEPAARESRRASERLRPNPRARDEHGAARDAAARQARRRDDSVQQGHGPAVPDQRARAEDPQPARGKPARSAPKVARGDRA